MASTLNGKSLIKVINNSNGSASFIGMDGKKYLFTRRGAYRPIELSVIEGLYNEYPNFISEGYIIFEDKKVYDYLEIPEEIVGKLMSFNDIDKILEKDAEEIKEILADLPNPIKENVAVIAKEKKIDSKKKIKAIKEATGFDVENDENE